MIKFPNAFVQYDLRMLNLSAENVVARNEFFDADFSPLLLRIKRTLSYISFVI